MRTYHQKRVSNLGMEVMGKSVSRSRRQGQEDAGKNVNKQEKGVV